MLEVQEQDFSQTNQPAPEEHAGAMEETVPRTPAAGASSDPFAAPGPQEPTTPESTEEAPIEDDPPDAEEPSDPSPVIRRTTHTTAPIAGIRPGRAS